MISHSSSTVLLSSEPPSAETPSLGGKEMLSDDSLLTASWALNWKINKNTLSTNVTDQYRRYFKQPLQSDSTIRNANRDSVPVDFHWRIIFTCVNFTRENKMYKGNNVWGSKPFLTGYVVWSSDWPDQHTEPLVSLSLKPWPSFVLPMSSCVVVAFVQPLQHGLLSP